MFYSSRIVWYCLLVNFHALDGRFLLSSFSLCSRRECDCVRVNFWPLRCSVVLLGHPQIVIIMNMPPTQRATSSIKTIIATCTLLLRPLFDVQLGETGEKETRAMKFNLCLKTRAKMLIHFVEMSRRTSSVYTVQSVAKYEQIMATQLNPTKKRMSIHERLLKPSTRFSTNHSSLLLQIRLSSEECAIVSYTHSNLFSHALKPSFSSNTVFFSLSQN